MAKRAYSPKEISDEDTYKDAAVGWSLGTECFGLPEENSTWVISGSSTAGKSVFSRMQLARELTNYGQVLYLSMRRA
jgi:hypothetical protein